MKTSLPLKQVKLNTIARLAGVLFIFMMISGMSFGQTPQEYITISKSGPANANPGDLITYTITIGNGHPTDDWTGTITDILPDEFTYDSFITDATYVNSYLSGTTLIWTDLEVPQGKTEVITITGHAGKLGNTFTEQLNPSTYYMENSNVITYLTNSVTLEYGSVGNALTAKDTTEVEQICDFIFYGQEGEVKSSPGSINKYLVILYNLGNVWDRFQLYMDPNNNEYASCENPLTHDYVSATTNNDLHNAFQALDGTPITNNTWTPWIAPGEAYAFYIVLTTPIGTPATTWNCTDLTITSDVCNTLKTETFHTWIHNPRDPYLSVQKIDFPDPVTCNDILHYKIYIANTGKGIATSTVLTETYDPHVTFIEATPAPDPGTNNVWTLGNIPEDGSHVIDIVVELHSGITNGYSIQNQVLATYNGTYSTIATAQTLVNAFPDLVITKTASATSVKKNEYITYTLTYYNTGCGAATGVVIDDFYDDDHTVITDAADGTVTNGKISWVIGEITTNDPVTLCGRITNRWSL